MHPKNSLASLMTDYYDSDDDEGAEENVQNNLNFLNLNPPPTNKLSPGSLTSISKTNHNNNDMVNAPSPNVSVEKPSDQQEPANLLASLNDDISLPPPPTNNCAYALQEKITNLYRKIQAGQLDMNQWIQERKDFRNPSIYDKLVGFCNIDELGTNYPIDKFDPSHWSEDSFYDKLAEAQNEKMNQLTGKK